MPKLNQQKIYLGIDPGMQGGLALVSNRVLEWAAMPNTDMDLFHLLDGWANNFDLPITGAMIELVGSRPGEAAKGAFTFGQGYGKLLMALTATKIGYDKVTPRTWQKSLGVKVKRPYESKPQFKERLRATAQQLFPSFPLWEEPKTKGKQMAVCDAILIAEYCKRKHEGRI